MSKPAIEIKNLSKKYRIDHYGKNKLNTIWDVISNTIRKPASLFTGDRAEHEAFWALKGVDLTIEKGDVVGIIGRNGSGKSTMLKVLSQIVEPTTGSITMRGRVASLLEVGTGFHPELTGRENIYFNGSILGMSRKEISAKFNDIVEFSEIEKFLDTPVKFYSSGMYVRLAFSVAAHLDPDILIVDEVLAVGDAAFQKKCLGKMKDVAGEGRTVLFVSHSIHAVKQLCDKGVYLVDGKVVSSGDIEKVTSDYMQSMSSNAANDWQNDDFPQNEYFTPKKISLSQIKKSSFTTDEPVTLTIEGSILKEDPLFNIGYHLYTEEGETIYWSYTNDLKEKEWPSLRAGSVTLQSQIPAGLLNEGSYVLELTCSLHNKLWIIEPGYGPTLSFDMKLVSDSPRLQQKRPGILAPSLKWEVK